MLRAEIEHFDGRHTMVANIAFITGTTNKSINVTGPEVYLKKVPSRILKSQCVPLDSTLWRIEKAGRFFDARKKLLSDSFNDFLDEVLPERRLGNDLE